MKVVQFIGQKMYSKYKFKRISILACIGVILSLHLIILIGETLDSS